MISCWVHTWANKYYLKHDGYDVKPVHIFLSGREDTGKSHVVKVINNAISKTLLYHSQEFEEARALLFGHT